MEFRKCFGKMTHPTITLIANTATIECGETLTGSIGNQPNSVSYMFENDVVRSVSFTDCETTFDPELFLIDSSGNNIQNQSTNNCDGDDCTDPKYHCARKLRETFTMEQLAVGTYTVQLAPYSTGGDWSLAIYCDGPHTESPTSDPTVDPTLGYDPTASSGTFVFGYVRFCCKIMIIWHFTGNFRY